MTKEILEKLGIEEKLLEKILIILKDNIFYDKYGHKYETPCLYYNCGWCIVDAETSDCDVGIENYGKYFARELSEIENLELETSDYDM